MSTTALKSARLAHDGFVRPTLEMPHQKAADSAMQMILRTTCMAQIKRLQHSISGKSGTQYNAKSGARLLPRKMSTVVRGHIKILFVQLRNML